MDAEQRVRQPVESAPPTVVPPRILGVGSSVVLLRPRKLRGTIGIVQRRLGSDWEVEIRSAEGTPMHLTLPLKALHLRRAVRDHVEFGVDS